MKEKPFTAKTNMLKDCYQIITDKSSLEEFIDWLPEHSREETYFYALFYREKYNTGAKKSDGGNLLFRGISDKKSLSRKIQQLECPLAPMKRRENGMDEGLRAPASDNTTNDL